jgi:hypothetical protein
MTKAQPGKAYKIRVGKRWLVSLVVRPGGAVLSEDEGAAGAFTGPNATAGEARLLLGYEPRVWCKPVDGGPGFWAF